MALQFLFAFFYHCSCLEFSIVSSIMRFQSLQFRESRNLVVDKNIYIFKNSQKSCIDISEGLNGHISERK